MSTTRRPEDVTADEIDRTWAALLQVGPLALPRSTPIGMDKDDVRDAIASGLLVPPPRVKTQMEKDEEEVKRRMAMPGNFTPDDGCEFWCILTRLFAAAKAAGVTY